LVVEIYQNFRSENMAAADHEPEKITNYVVDSLPVSVRPKKKMKGREECEMLEKVYRP